MVYYLSTYGLLICVQVPFLLGGGGAYCCELASVVPSVLVVSNQRVEYGVALYSLCGLKRYAYIGVFK